VSHPRRTECSSTQNLWTCIHRQSVRIQILYCVLYKVFHMEGNSSHVSKDTKILKFCSFFQTKFLFTFHVHISPTQQNNHWSKELEEWEQLKQVVDCEIYYATYHTTYLTKYKTKLHIRWFPFVIFNFQYNTCTLHVWVCVWILGIPLPQFSPDKLIKYLCIILYSCTYSMALSR
jgi:hypothetical protein